MAELTTAYLHTVNGKPAFFNGHELSTSTNPRKRNYLAASEEQINRERKIDVDALLKLGDPIPAYGFVKICGVRAVTADEQKAMQQRLEKLEQGVVSLIALLRTRGGDSPEIAGELEHIVTRSRK